MENGKVKVGAKIGTEHVQVECAIQIPQTVGDALRLSKVPEAICAAVDKALAGAPEKAVEFATDRFTRGWRIWNQEDSGARDLISSSSAVQRQAEGFAKQVQAVIDSADPLAPPSRTGRPAKPQEATITPEMQKALVKGDQDTFKRLLAEQGVKVNITFAK